MKKLLLLAILPFCLLGCQEDSIIQENPTDVSMEGGDHADHTDHADFTIEWIETVEDREQSKENTRGNNPHGLSAAVHSPYTIDSETDPAWAPPGHHTPWNGDWATDLWKDNGDSDSDYTFSCGENVYIDARPLQYPGGNAPHALKAKLLSHGYACASHNVADGGYAQKWEIIATYSGVDYPLGWVLYAHLDNVQYTATNTVVNLTPAAYIATAYWNGYSSACSGSCHIHMEFYNYRNWSCYDIMPPAVQIDRVGVVGGLSPSASHCPGFGPGLLSPINCVNSSAYNGSSGCAKAYDNNLGTKWTSDGSSPQSSMVVDLGSVKNVTKIVVKHASAGGEPTYYNTQHFKIEYGSSSIWGPWTLSAYGTNWNQAASETTLNVNFNARYVHLYIIDAGIDNHARIPEFQVYGN